MADGPAVGTGVGVGFGVSEGITYCGDFYNGIEGADIYWVRFVSCVGLHAIWSASVGIAAYRNQEKFQSDIDLKSLSLDVLQLVAVPMVLHGLYDALLTKDLQLPALGVAIASFAWLGILMYNTSQLPPRELEAV